MKRPPVYNIVDKPTVEPVTIDDLITNEWMKSVDLTDAATIAKVNTDIKSARNKAEERLNRKLLTQTWKVSLDYAPGKFSFPFGQLQSVAHVKIYAADGTANIESSSKYTVKTGDGGILWLNSVSGYTWTTTTRPYASFEIQFICGWTSAAEIPADIRTGIMAIITNLYYNREAINEEVINLFSGHEIIEI